MSVSVSGAGHLCSYEVSLPCLPPLSSYSLGHGILLALQA